MAHSNFEKDIEKFMEPVVDGIINPCNGDTYYKISLFKKYGEERVKKAIAEYDRRED